MDDACLVRRFKRLGDLLGDREGFVERDRPLLDPICQCWPFPGFPICLPQMAPLSEISDLPAPDGPFIHPKAAERSKRLFVTASSRFRGRQLSSGGCATH